MNGQMIVTFIGILAGIVIVFLICREIICWYWKINNIVALLEEQNRLLGELSRKIGSSGNVQNSSGSNSSQQNSAPIAKPTQVNFGETWICKKCNEKNPITASTCKGCGGYK